MQQPIAFADIDPAKPPRNRIILDMPYEVYQDYRPKDCVRATHLKAANQSEAHYLASVERSSAETAALKAGRWTHQALLEPELFADSVMKNLSNQRDVGLAKQAASIAQAVRTHPVAGPLVLAPDVYREATVIWQDQASGLLCKARFDAIGGLMVSPENTSGFVLDLKTTRVSDPHSFARDCYTYGYAVQMAHYLEGAAACGMVEPNGGTFYIVAAEKTEPYGLRIFNMADWHDYGMQWRRHAMFRISQAIQSGQYPCYAPDILALERPQWGVMPMEVHFEGEDFA